MAKKRSSDPTEAAEPASAAGPGPGNLRVDLVDVGSIDLDPTNARDHSDPAGQEAIRRSLTRFGQRKPIVVWRESPDAPGRVTKAGNGTLQVARELGWQQIWVAWADGLTQAEADAYAVADNQTALLSSWDYPQLAEVLRGLDDDLRLDTGFDDEEINKILRGAMNQGAQPGQGGDAYDCTPGDGQTRSAKGDLWIIRSGDGREHRLLVDDCTQPENVSRLMGGEKAGLMNTDPPYGIDYGDLAERRTLKSSKESDETKAAKRAERHIENDDLDGVDLQAFLEAAIRAATPHLIDNAAFYLWHPMLTQGAFFAAAAAAADILIHRQIIWVKPRLILGRGDYHWRHELCFYGWRRGFRPTWLGDRSQTTVWEVGFDATNAERVHPTQKPIELFSRPILNHLGPDEIAYEPFAGSGSQFVAAMRSGRRCYGMELSPRFADVILSRSETEGCSVSKASGLVAVQ